MNEKKLISIICPVYNEEENIPIFYNRLQNAIHFLKSKYNFELIFTDNGSTDKTLSVLKTLHEEDLNVQAIAMSRNFGYQASVLAGMKHAKGDAIITIDVDCEDPPELIPAFIEKWKEGFDIVYGQRCNRPENKIMIGIRKFFYRLLKFVADSDIITDMAEFALISSYVRDSVVDNESTYPFLRTDIAYAGYSKVGIKYDRQKRMIGKTHYNFWKMGLFAVGGILSSSTFPMRLGIYLSPILFFINLVLFLVYTSGFWQHAFSLLVTFDLTFLVTQISIYGLYIARIYKNSIKRPIYIINRKKSIINK